MKDFKFTLFHERFSDIERDWQRRMLRAALEGASELDTNMAYGARSGRKWSSLPNRSSRPSEFSQEQGGRIRAGQFVPHASMRESISARPLKDGAYSAVAGFGFYDHDLGKLLANEFGSATMRGRKNLTRTARSKRLGQRMREVTGR